MKIIKKEIVIAAPVEKVWAHITIPEKINGWLMPNDFAPEKGKNFTLHCAHEESISCNVKEVVTNEKLVYSFKPTSLKIDTLVTFLLAKEGNQTRLTLIHSGWDALPPGEQGVADGFNEGWGDHLKRLESQLN